MENLEKNQLIGISALLVHAAKADDNYTDQEKKIIKNFILSQGTEEDIQSILDNAEKIEADSNQLLSFTKIIKDNTDSFKFNIIEQLWKILISDNKVDQYESNLMRRICGLIYFSDKQSGEIKMRLMKSK
mgnify:FL=1|jgi:uncharacterized tellurite resistance protein B-like protein|tara:strand:+ start:1837 stop:2226 length:390 start_codon:yes stop_codon:yes gene_type:complete